MVAAPLSNFSFLKPHDEQLVRLGRLSERYFPEDPNTCLLKLRQLAELLAQLTATRVGIYQSAEEGQYELINRLRSQGILTPEVSQLFGEVRRAGNAANHALRAAVEMAKDARPIDIAPWLFCTKRGEGYFDEETGEATGWDSMWQRFMSRLLSDTKIT